LEGFPVIKKKKFKKKKVLKLMHEIKMKSFGGTKTSNLATLLSIQNMTRLGRQNQRNKNDKRNVIKKI
jgi:hypothetical protein